MYIGSSYDPEKRCLGHREKHWWPLVSSRTEERYDTRVAAYLAEMAQIRAEDPPHNLMGTPGWTWTASEALQRRDEDNRARGRIQSAAYKVERETYTAARSAGATWQEAWVQSNDALTDFLEASEMFPAWVARLRDRQRSGRSWTGAVEA